VIIGGCSIVLRYKYFGQSLDQYIRILALRLTAQQGEDKSALSGAFRNNEKATLISISIYFHILQFPLSVEKNIPLYLYNYLILFIIILEFLFDIYFLFSYSVLISLFN
jgi:hypothetical protein